MDTVASIMTTAVQTVRTSDVIGPVRDLMLDRGIGCVPVVDDHGALRGIITSSDLVEEWAPQMGVQTVMSGEVVTVPPHRSVAEAARQMAMRHVHHLVVTERDCLNAANQVRQRWIHHQILEELTVSGANELDTTFGDGARCLRFEFGADFVDDDDLGHVVFDGFNHDGMLFAWALNLHATRASDACMGDIAVTGDFV